MVPNHYYVWEWFNVSSLVPFVERSLLDMNAYLQAMNLDPNNCKKNEKEKAVRKVQVNRTIFKSLKGKKNDSNSHQ
ncbi:hypothetical protein Syun_029351 [Stephania yunnanensis]|uniref:Uncharacterized protein n=1 Tax=Stephania yunnanensis TaxID=152371 RepID=A0AAP0E9S4_9MAGN